MLPNSGRINVGGQKLRPSTASMTRPGSGQTVTLPPANPTKYVTNGDINKQLLQIKETDLELAKARFDFQIGLEKKRTLDYQSMLKDNYEEAAKMFQKINNEQLELIKKENENVMQKLLKRHNEEIVSLTAKHEQEIRALAEEKRRLADTCEERIRDLKREFGETLDRERSMNEKRIEDVKEELRVKHEKKIEAQKEKMKEKLNAVKEKSEKKASEKIDEVFQKMNEEFEVRNNDLYKTLVEKDNMVKTLEHKLRQYQMEVDRWKDMYYSVPIIQEAPKEKTLEVIEKKVVDNIQKEESERPKEENEFVCETLHVEEKEEVNEDKENLSPRIQEQEEQVRKSMDITKHERVETPLKEEIEQFEKRKPVQEVEKCDAETMTDRFVQSPQEQEGQINNEELDEFVGRAEEKAEFLVNRDVEAIRFYQNALVKCLGKLKEYQIFIQKFNCDF